MAHEADSLAASQQVQGQRTGLLRARQCAELFCQPVAKQVEQLSGILPVCVCGFFTELGVERTNWATKPAQAVPVGHNHVHKTPQAVPGVRQFPVPCRQRRTVFFRELADNGIKDVLLGLEVVVDIAALDTGMTDDIAERCTGVTTLVEKRPGGSDNFVPRLSALTGHESKGNSYLPGHECGFSFTGHRRCQEVMGLYIFMGVFCRVAISSICMRIASFQCMRG